MKTVLFRSTLVGVAAMVLQTACAAVFVALALNQDASVISRENVLVSYLYIAWFPFALFGRIGMPILLAMISLLTWRLTREFSSGLSLPEAKKRLMFSIWIASALTILPSMILSTALALIAPTISTTDPGSQSGAGMVTALAMCCLPWDFTLALASGLLSRLLVKEMHS